MKDSGKMDTDGPCHDMATGARREFVNDDTYRPAAATGVSADLVNMGQAREM